MESAIHQHTLASRYHFMKNRFSNIPSNLFMEPYNIIEHAKEMLELIAKTPAILYASFFVSILSIISFVLVAFLIRELIQVLKGMLSTVCDYTAILMKLATSLDIRTDGKYKMNVIKKVGTLEQNHERLVQQLHHLAHNLTELEQGLQRKRQEREASERLDTTRYDFLRSRMDILDKFREDNAGWNQFQQDQEFSNCTLLESIERLTKKITELETQFTATIINLAEKIRELDHIATDNFNNILENTKTMYTYCIDNKEQSSKTVDAMSALQVQVNQELRALETQISDLERKLARLQSACSSFSSITQRIATPQAKDKGKDKDAKDKQPDTANETASLELRPYSIGFE
ncbi:hypothetical protein MBANPS3_000528 [Mucor bainieri]